MCSNLQQRKINTKELINRIQRTYLLFRVVTFKIEEFNIICSMKKAEKIKLECNSKTKLDYKQKYLDYKKERKATLQMH